MKRSWKSTVSGLLLAIALFLTGHPDLFPAAEVIGSILAPLAAFIGGSVVRDADVTSEQSGAVEDV